VTWLDVNDKPLGDLRDPRLFPRDPRQLLNHLRNLRDPRLFPVIRVSS
jgi:hypothetical protein